MEIRKLITTGVASLLGAAAGNLVYHLLRSHRQAQRVRVGALPDTEVIGAAWVPESTIAATLLASRVKERPGTLGFLLALAFALVARSATGQRNFS